MKPGKGMVLVSSAFLLFSLVLAVSWDLGVSVVDYKSITNPNNLLVKDSSYTTLGYLYARYDSDCPDGFSVRADGAVCLNDDSSGGYMRGWEIIDFGSDEFTSNIRLQVSDLDISCWWRYCDIDGYPTVKMFYSSDAQTWKWLGTTGGIDDQTYLIKTLEVNDNMRYLIVSRHGGGSARPDPVVHYVERSTDSGEDPEPQGEPELIIETETVNVTGDQVEAAFSIALPTGSSTTYSTYVFDPDFQMIDTTDLSAIDYEGRTYTPYIFMPEKLGKYLAIGLFFDGDIMTDIQIKPIEVV